MKRRLDLASALVHEPEVLFLDEPTTGLDPASRLTVWDEVRRINERGTTVFLTTQYLEEADQLCDRLAIIDGGLIVREGTPAELKAELRAREGSGPIRRSTTSSSTPPDGRADASQAMCRRCRDDVRVGSWTARAARGMALAGGADPHPLHPPVLPRGQRRPGRQDLPIELDAVPEGAGLCRLPAAELAAAGGLVRDGCALSRRGHRERLLRQAARGTGAPHVDRARPADRRGGQGAGHREPDRRARPGRSGSGSRAARSGSCCSSG